MRLELRDSLEFVYPDSQVSAKPRQAMELDVPRGSIASVQVLGNDLKAGQTLRLTVRQRGSVERAAKWFRLIDVPVEKNTGPVGFVEKEGERNEFVVRRAPFRVYDALEPLAGSVPVKHATGCLLLQIPIPADARPGERCYELSISDGSATAEFCLTVHVHKAVLPAVGEKTLPYTNWFSYPDIAKRHSLRPWTPPYWRMLKRYAQMMAHARQNTFWIPLREIFKPTPQGPVLDEARLVRIVRIFSDAGLYWIEGGHWGVRSNNDWMSPTFDLTVGSSTPESPRAWPTAGPLATALAGTEALAIAAAQLVAAIDRHGWRKRWLQHIADEPIGVNATDYRLLAGAVRKFMPGIPILDATMDPTLLGAVNIWCPQAQEYQKHRDRFDLFRKLGDKVWFYTCCFPGGPWLNRLLDEELLRPTLLGWAAALFDLDGFLHWGLNHYKEWQDPFALSVVNHGGSSELPGGDTHIVYPGTAGPWSSVRLEAQREGLEDYELLRQLARKNPKSAATLTKKVIQGFDQYTKDPAVLRTVRRQLLQKLAK
ncbi:MAG: DUF4091 domain-containing protein [Phycisphaeraceae bacterium]|nr:DUF4091 domain-containing protein [Phycisphaeraceae bacterium]